MHRKRERCEKERRMKDRQIDREREKEIERERDRQRERERKRQTNIKREGRMLEKFQHTKKKIKFKRKSGCFIEKTKRIH